MALPPKQYSPFIGPQLLAGFQIGIELLSKRRFHWIYEMSDISSKCEILPVVLNEL